MGAKGGQDRVVTEATWSSRYVSVMSSRMPVKRVTAWPTEADLEAAIEAGLQRAFPWLPRELIKHQTKFAFSFGRSTIEVNGATTSRSEARAWVAPIQGGFPP